MRLKDARHFSASAQEALRYRVVIADRLVQQFLAQRFELSVSVWTVGRYLKKWGFTPQKPLRRAYEQDRKAVKHWLETEYPQICREAHYEKAEIHAR